MSDYDSTVFYVFSDRGALLQQGISAGCGQYAVYQNYHELGNDTDVTVFNITEKAKVELSQIEIN